METTFLLKQFTQRTFVRWTLRIALFFCCACIAFRFWPSDLSHWTAPLAYVPGPVLALWMFFHVFVFRLFRSGYIGLIVLLLVFTFWREYEWECRHEMKPAAALRLFHWNVWNVRRSFERVVDTIAEVDPDVILLNEPKSSRKAKDFPAYMSGLKKKTGTEWHMATGHYLAILSKYPLHNVQEKSEKGYQALFVVVEGIIPKRVLLLDVSPALTNSRKQTFLKIAADLEHLNPDVVAGDLNTPSHTVSLSPLLQSYSSTHCGLGYTWPTFAPMMRIDHILVRHSMTTSRSVQGSTLLSDHAWQYIDIP